MAQIVHDLAPGAAIDFATAFSGEPAFADNITGLAARRRQGDRRRRRLLRRAVLPGRPGRGRDQRVSPRRLLLLGRRQRQPDRRRRQRHRLLGNAGIPRLGALPAAARSRCRRPAATTASTSTPEPAARTTFGITVEAGEMLTVDLQWAEPWNGVETDLDAFLLDGDGDLIDGDGATRSRAGEDNAGGCQQPFEFLSWENEGPEAEVQLVDQPLLQPRRPRPPRLKFALLQNGGGVSDDRVPAISGGDIVGPTIFGHAGAAAAIASAPSARRRQQPEAYSSRGPVTHYFGPVAGTAPAAATRAQTIAKPDLAATDCGVTTFFVPARTGALPLLRHLGRGPARGRGRRPDAAGEPGACRRPRSGPAWRDARAGRRLRPERRGRRSDRRLGAVDAVALPPTIAITKAPQPLGRNRRPTIEFSANRPVAFPARSTAARRSPAPRPSPCRRRSPTASTASPSAAPTSPAARASANASLHGRHQGAADDHRQAPAEADPHPPAPGRRRSSASAPTSRGRPSSARSTAACCGFCGRRPRRFGPAAHGPGPRPSTRPATSTARRPSSASGSSGSAEAQASAVPAAWRRMIQCPTSSSASSAAAVPSTSGSVSARPSSRVPK